MEKKAHEIINFINNIIVYPNTAIVYDIDDTLINTNGEPICPIIATYKNAIARKIKTIIITARSYSPYNLQNTINQLAYYGIKDYEFLILRPSNITDLFFYKEKMREKMKNNGYNIVASIGDMPWDIGKYGGVNFLI